MPVIAIHLSSLMASFTCFLLLLIIYLIIRELIKSHREPKRGCTEDGLHYFDNGYNILISHDEFYHKYPNEFRPDDKPNRNLRLTIDALAYYDNGINIIIPRHHFYKRYPEEQNVSNS